MRFQAAASVHTHDDRYYTETEINNLLAGKSNTGHNHDTRYYTESESNSRFAPRSTISATAANVLAAIVAMTNAQGISAISHLFTDLNTLASLTSRIAYRYINFKSTSRNGYNPRGTSESSDKRLGECDSKK